MNKYNQTYVICLIFDVLFQWDLNLMVYVEFSGDLISTEIQN